MSPLKRLGKLGLLGSGLFLALGFGLHIAVGRAARLVPPKVTLPGLQVVTSASGVRHFGLSYVRRQASLLQVGLSGSPEDIGYAHARLLYPEMVENEGILLTRFKEQVPSQLLRSALLDLAQFRYRAVDAEMAPNRLREVAAGALAFQPDPFAAFFPTFQRFVYLNALYDISLSFEGSPLIGCTTFTFDKAATADGSGVLARAFDFEVDAIFDRRKALFLVKEDGKIPFASVAWPGLVGVVSGMNLEGVAVVVHGGRAGAARTSGEPVVHALRRVLAEARSSDEAVQLLAERTPMVSHIVIVSDRRGRSAAIERAPGTSDTVRWLPTRAATTNHFEGPLREDPRNLNVRATTSSVPRRERADELLAGLAAANEAITPQAALRLLRDRQGKGGRQLPLGDRRAIDALIATHGVIMQTGPLKLWLSEAPHLLGQFVAFDLPALLADSYDPEAATTEPAETLAADALLTTGDYAKWQASPKQ